MSAYTPTVPHASVEERLARLESMATTVVPSIPPAPTAKIPTWLAVLNVGTLLAVVIAVVTFAFYLGGLNNTAITTAQNLDKLNTAVVGTSRDSIASRLSVIETKLDALPRSEPPK